MDRQTELSGEYGLVSLGVAGFEMNWLDPSDPHHRRAFLRLMRQHAEAMGAPPLSVQAEARLLGFVGFRAILATAPDGRIVGMGTCYDAYDTFQARPVLCWEHGFVEARYRSAGIGTEMHRWLRAHAVAIGACEIRFPVPDGNEGVLRLHLRHGAERVEGSRQYRIRIG